MKPPHISGCDATAGPFTFTQEDLDRSPPDPPIYWARRLVSAGIWPDITVPGEGPFTGSLVIVEKAYSREFWRHQRGGALQLEDRQALVAHHRDHEHREVYPDLTDPGTQGVLDKLLLEGFDAYSLVVEEHAAAVIGVRGDKTVTAHGKPSDPSLRAQLLLKVHEED